MRPARGASRANPLDLGDALGGAQTGDDVREVAEVAHVDVDEDLEEVLLPVDDLEVGDSAFLAGHSVGQAGEDVGVVGGDDADAGVVLFTGLAAAEIGWQQPAKCTAIPETRPVIAMPLSGADRALVRGSSCGIIRGPREAVRSSG